MKEVIWNTLGLLCTALVCSLLGSWIGFIVVAGW